MATDTTSAVQSLLPCPFCGGAASVARGYCVRRWANGRIKRAAFRLAAGAMYKEHPHD